MAESSTKTRMWLDFVLFSLGLDSGCSSADGDELEQVEPVTSGLPVVCLAEVMMPACVTLRAFSGVTEFLAVLIKAGACMTLSALVRTNEVR